MGGLRQINTCRQVTLLVNLGFGVFIDIWSMALRFQKRKGKFYKVMDKNAI
jgi:hypothetical protein